ncbi:unnamed protein product, partial [Polarella glacialis]
QRGPPPHRTALRGRRHGGSSKRHGRFQRPRRWKRSVAEGGASSRQNHDEILASGQGHGLRHCGQREPGVLRLLGRARHRRDGTARPVRSPLSRRLHPGLAQEEQRVSSVQMGATN